MPTAQNNNLHQAKKAKKDEFYTQLPDIERELAHYKKHFRGKVVLCNCDDPRVSNFYDYFARNFEFLELKKLIATCYKNQNPEVFSDHKCEKAVWLEYNGDTNDNRIPDRDETDINHLQGDGDFRSAECIALLKQVDVVVTNPPFSLFREYVVQLVKYGKKFLIIGSKNAITYKEIFKLIKENKVWVGNQSMSIDMLFDIPKNYSNELIATKKEGSSYKIINGIVKGRAPSVWFTNMDHAKRHENLILHKKYSPGEYPKYDNYNAINVNKVKDIPKNYKGAMGVPITFLDKYNPDQFEIVKFRKGDDDKDLSINGKYTYFRIIIKNKKVKK